VENVNVANDNMILNQKSEDFVSETLAEEETQLHEEIKKRKLTLIGLGSIYIVLILASFTFLT